MKSYFRPEEFRCRCGRQDCDAPKDVAPALLDALNWLRELWGHPITVTSGLRCRYWNERSGGKPDSEHMTGEAADIACVDSATRYALLKRIFALKLVSRIGIGATFLHLGVSTRHPQQVVWHYYA